MPNPIVGVLQNSQWPWVADNPATQTENGPNAVITVNDINPTDPLADFADTDKTDLDVWTDFIVRGKYESDKHIYMMPIASPNGFSPNQFQQGGVLQNNQIGQVAAFVQLASPTLLWIADWTAARFNDQPIIPSKVPIDPRWILLDEHYEPVNIITGPDGQTPLYRMSGTFVFGCTNPSNDILNDVAWGRPPWLLDNYNRQPSPNNVSQGLIDFNFNLFAASLVPPGIGTFGS